MFRVFVSYRTEDSALAGAIREGVGRVPFVEPFLDTRSLEPGADLPSVLSRALTESHLVLVAIGPAWMAARDRLASPADWVRRELQLAIEETIPFLPVLQAGTRMPSASELPEALRPLTDTLAVSIDLRQMHATRGFAEVVSRHLEGIAPALRRKKRSDLEQQGRRVPALLDSWPLTFVRLSGPDGIPFEISQQPLSVGQWMAVFGPPPEPRMARRSPTNPVTSMSWARAAAFCQSLSAHEGGVPFRLPTFEEWSLAQRCDEIEPGTPAEWLDGPDLNGRRPVGRRDRTGAIFLDHIDANFVGRTIGVRVVMPLTRC